MSDLTLALSLQSCLLDLISVFSLQVRVGLDFNVKPAIVELISVFSLQMRVGLDFSVNINTEFDSI
jgi:hypothetical protein